MLFWSGVNLWYVGGGSYTMQQMVSLDPRHFEVSGILGGCPSPGAFQARPTRFISAL